MNLIKPLIDLPDQVEKPENLSVLVVSCDRYSDIWPYFFNLFEKYWSDCPYPIYLGSNRIKYESSKITHIMTVNDISWADSTKKMVEIIETDYFLFFLEDFFIIKPIETRNIEYCFSVLKQLNGAYLRLRPFPKPDKFLKTFPEIGQIDIGAPYRLALQAAIWRKDVFLDLIQAGETAWDMEIKGSRRSDTIQKGFFCTWKPMINYEAGITMGKWSLRGIKIIKKEKLQIDFNLRMKMTRVETLILLSRRMNYRLLNILPWKLRRNLKNIIK